MFRVQCSEAAGAMTTQTWCDYICALQRNTLGSLKIAANLNQWLDFLKRYKKQQIDSYDEL